MSSPLHPEVRQHRIDAVRRMTTSQASYIADLVDSRFAPDDPAREELRQQWHSIKTRNDVSTMIEQLKAMPRLETQQRREALTQRPDTDGYYRNPETGELYRISHGARQQVIVSKYSQTGGPRRLVSDLSQIVKGKWTRLGKFDTRRALAHIKLAWQIDAATLAQDYAYGFCPLHHGPLTDAVSVVLGYGPDCAEKYGLPWSEEAAQARLRELTGARS